MTPTRADVLTTLYTLVSDDQLRMYACIYAGFPREWLPGRGASLADLAAAIVDTATPEVWAKFVSSLSADRPKRYVEISLLRRWVPGSPPPRRIFALVALDGSGVHGLGADPDSARAHALSTRDDGDPAWLDTLRAVTLSGEPAAVQALVDSLSSLPAGGDVWEGT